MFRNFLFLMILCLLNIPLSRCRSYISPISFSRYDFQLLSRFQEEYFYPSVDLLYYSYFLFQLFPSASLSAHLQNILQPIGIYATPNINNTKLPIITGQCSSKYVKIPCIPMILINPENPIRAIPNNTPRKSKHILIYLISFYILFIIYTTKITIKIIII